LEIEFVGHPRILPIGAERAQRRAELLERSPGGVRARRPISTGSEARSMAMSAEPLFTPVGSSHLGRPSLLARYASLPDLRHAIDTLEGEGVDGDHLTMVARHRDMPGGTERQRADSRMLSHTMLYLAFGVIIGALAGAAFGAALTGLIVLIWSELDASGWIVLMITVWFAAGGAVLGCFTAVSRVVGFSESWALTFEDEPEGPVWLAVFEDVDDPAELATHTHALEVVTDPPPLRPEH
jgi:hypothetical protein